MTISTQQSIPLLDLNAQYQAIGDEMRAAVIRVLETQRFILGPEVKALEDEIAAYSNARYGIGVSSGTDALLAVLMALNIGPGDEVITTSYSFFATGGCVSRVGAKPVYVDIDPKNYNIDPDAIEKVITNRTRAIIPVHLFGQVAEMDKVMAVARKHNLVVIEDAAQAIGSEYCGERAGTIGTVGCFSFYPTKNLGGVGDGGMIVTNDPDLAERIRLFRTHGASPKYFHRFVGGNFRLDAIQAAVLRVKLNYLDQWTAGRQANAETYRKLFSDAKISITYDEFLADPMRGVVLPHEEPERRHIYNQFVIRVKERDALIDHLKSAGIGVEVYYPLPLHLQDCFSDLGYKEGDLPISESAAKETLALPVYPELPPGALQRVVSCIQEFISA